MVQGVTVAVTPGNLDEDSSVWDFAVAFDSQGKRLDDQILDSVVLVGDGRRIKPLAWEGEAAGGKHRAGVLKFIAIQPRPKEMQLQMTRARRGQAADLPLRVRGLVGLGGSSCAHRWGSPAGSPQPTGRPVPARGMGPVGWR